MQESLTNPVSPLIPGFAASGVEKSSHLQGKEKGAFFEVLSLLSSGTSGLGTPAGTEDGKQIDGVSADPSDLLSSLLTSDISDLSQSLQIFASVNGAGMEKSSSASANNSDASNGSGSAGKAGRFVETLLSALAALLGTKRSATDGALGAGDNLPSGMGTGDQASAGAASTPPDSPGSLSASDDKISSDDQVDHQDPNQDTENALATLAILVFNSLAAVLQRQPQETPAEQGSAGTMTNGLSSEGGQANGMAGGPGQGMIYQALVDLERLRNGALPAPQPMQDEELGQQTVDEANATRTQAGSTQQPGNIPIDLLRTPNRSSQAADQLKTEGDKGSPKGTEVTKTPPQVSSEAKGSPSAEIRLALGSSAAEGGDKNDTLTVAIRTPLSPAAQNSPTQVTNEATGAGSAPKEESAPENADPAITRMVKDLSPLLKRDHEGSLHDNGGDKEQPSGQESYPFAAKADAAGTGGAGQEQVGKTSGQHIATAAVERFEKIIEQLGRGTGQHDLTVKLDMGKEGSVILGLKDMGPSVTVEVRASDQGIINLLQSQKESIIKNLEGKDVHTNIFIDPNASGTPDKKDRRETGKQRAFQPTSGVDAGFGEFLEVFA